MRGFHLFGSTAVGEPFRRMDDPFTDIVLDQVHVPNRTLPSFQWTECTVSSDADFEAKAVRSVRIWDSTAAGWHLRRLPSQDNAIDDDTGDNFITLMWKAPSPNEPDNQVRYLGAIWLAPTLEASTLDGWYKFEVEITKSGHRVVTRESVPFRVGPESAGARSPVPLAHDYPRCP